MEGGAAAAIEVLVQTLINFSKEEISLIQRLDIDAEKLKTNLSMIQSYLKDAETKLITQDAVRTWLRNLEAVAFRADNALDELKYHLLHKEVNKMKTRKEKVKSFFSLFDHIERPRNLALTIKQINEDFDYLKQNATALGLESILVSAPAAVPDAAFETDPFTLDPIFIGRDDDAPKLVEMLTHCPEDRKISVVAIVGMGGMGKTTLARKVFNHQNIKTRFGSLIWVHVSQTFDPIILFNKILASFTSETDEAESSERVQEERGAISKKLKKSFKAKHDEGGTRQDILKNLQKALKAKTYLLVLDDVWNQDLQKWEGFMNSLSGVTSIKGNGIIITTRSEGVTQIVNPHHIHHLNGLSDEDCRSIIKAKAFPNMDIVPSDFHAIIGGEIARRCQGLPLAANVVGGVLRDKSEQEWLAIQEKWLSDGDGDNISKILRLSYDNLSSPSLKKCFAYCSIFPKGERIVKQELIELWMAEEFLQADRGNDMESVGIKFLNVLLQNSLLQVAERDDYGNVKICVMHDLVHHLACSVLGSSNNPNGINQGHQRYRCESCPISKEEANHVRTLFFEGDNISHIKFSNFKCLHALTLSGRGVEELPSSIRKLIHLRNLNIVKTRIECLPDSIGELHQLQTLRTYVMKLPSTSKYLISLRHLFIRDATKLFPEIGRLTSLQTLTHFRVGDEKGCQIEELGSLKNLKGKIKISCLEKVHSKEEAEKANIFQKPNLFELIFKWGWRREGESRNDKNVLEGLQPHPNLKKLEIIGFKAKQFPLWTLKMAVQDDLRGFWVGLNKLMEIRLSWCKECEEIPTLGQLPKLKSLYLDGFYNLKSINSSFYSTDNEINIVFPALERLTLSDMVELREWEEVEFGSATETRPNCVKVFPHLQYLKIHVCRRLMSVPSYFSSCLKQLEITSMDSCVPLANICGVKLRSLTDLYINYLDGLECLPDWLFHNNQDLKKLTMCSCKKLRKLPDGLDTLKSLEELIISDCPDMTSIGYPSGGQSQGVLRSLRINDCQGLMDLPPDMIESWAPSLERLSFERLNSLENLPMVIDFLAKSAHRLTELRIVGVPVFVATYSVENWRFRSLRDLEIDVSMGWLREHSVAIKKTVDGILLACSHSLVSLKLEGMEIGEYLPESIQKLTALSELYLRNFGIEELPEWFGNLSSLEMLCLHNCKNLRCLPSVDALESLTRLEELHIQLCPELHIDPKWRNKPHLSIYVDDHKLEPFSERPMYILEEEQSLGNENLHLSDECGSETESEKSREELTRENLLITVELEKLRSKLEEEYIVEEKSHSYLEGKEMEHKQSEIEESFSPLRGHSVRKDQDAGSSDGTSLPAVELQKENVAAFPVEELGSEQISTSQSKRHEEGISLQEKERYLVIVEDNHLQLKLDNLQNILIEDNPDISLVNSMLNLVEQDLRELPENPNYPNLLLLFLQRNRRLTFIHPSFFDSMPALQFLDISDTKIRILPSSLFKLSKLKVLLLRNCVCLDNLPREIGKLKQLEALDLSGTELYDIPDEIGQLGLLRSMQLSFYGPDDRSEYEHLPSQLVYPSFLSELKEIQALSISVHPEDHRWTEIVACIINDINKLETLSYLQFYFPQVEMFETFIQTSPSWEKQKVSKFDFIVGQNVKRIASRVPDEVESSFNQHERCLRYVNGDSASPLFKTVIIRVTAFYLDHHTEVQSLSEFDMSNLQALKFCVVRECPKIQTILDEKNVVSAFPCLENLQIYFLWELKQIWQPPSPAGRLKRIFRTPRPSGNFKALRYLIINTCPKLQFILWESMVQCLTSLEELVVEDCEQVEKIIKEEKKKVKYEDNVLPRLRKLVLHYLPELVSVGNGVCLSEEKISVYGCPKLNGNSQFPNLSHSKH